MKNRRYSNWDTHNTEKKKKTEIKKNPESKKKHTTCEYTPLKRKDKTRTQIESVNLFAHQSFFPPKQLKTTDEQMKRDIYICTEYIIISF